LVRADSSSSVNLSFSIGHVSCMCTRQCVRARAGQRAHVRACEIDKGRERETESRRGGKLETHTHAHTHTRTRTHTHTHTIMTQASNNLVRPPKFSKRAADGLLDGNRIDHVLCLRPRLSLASPYTRRARAPLPQPPNPRTH